MPCGSGGTGQQKPPTTSRTYKRWKIKLTKITKIDYENLVQESLRSVMKQALILVAKNGLPGTHHFYLSFKTDYPEVDVPDYLKEEYPEEITIVLQYEFWDLEVTDDHFCVTLCFNDIHERLMIPFNAITSFVDPSVKFGLHFMPVEVPTKQVKPLPVEEKKKNSRKGSSSSVEKSKGGTGKQTSNVVALDTFRKK